MQSILITADISKFEQQLLRPNEAIDRTIHIDGSTINRYNHFKDISMAFSSADGIWFERKVDRTKNRKRGTTQCEQLAKLSICRTDETKETKEGLRALHNVAYAQCASLALQAAACVCMSVRVCGCMGVSEE